MISNCCSKLQDVLGKRAGIQHLHGRFPLEGVLENLGEFLVNRQLSSIEEAMASALRETGISDYLLSIKGVGVVSLRRKLGFANLAEYLPCIIKLLFLRQCVDQGQQFFADD